jgi:hypothetical protein
MHMKRPSMAMCGGMLRAEKLSSTTTGVGTTSRSRGRVLGLPIDRTTTVTEWVPTGRSEGRVYDDVSDVQSALALVAAGLGSHPVPASLQTFRRRGVVYRPLRTRSLSIEMGLAWRRDDDSALVQQFRRVAHETDRRADRRS